jgi:hypothetical protein
MKALSAFLIVFLFLTAAPVFSMDLSPVERQALIDLYNSTGGDHWTDRTGWKTPPLHTDGFALPGTENYWFGVGLAGEGWEDARVVFVSSLRLGSNNLSGTLPESLSHLSKIRSINFDVNHLTGSIPASLGNLSHLKGLDLSENRLTGDIPPSLGDLGELVGLGLEKNRLSGTIPLEIGKLGKLQGLSLNDNLLSGGIPAFIGNISSLWYVSLGHNNLTGTIPSCLHGFYLLDLAHNSLTGSIPSILLNDPIAAYCNLEHNDFSGRIPIENVGSCNLHVLDLSHNRLSGSIPEEIGSKDHLYDLDLASNRLSGRIPSSLAALTYSWLVLDLGHNALHAADSGLIAFLNLHDPDWAMTQTVVPSNVTAAPFGISSIKVAWTPIAYSAGPGGYRVFVSTTQGGPWAFYAQTSEKSASSLQVDGLSPGTPYFFVVQTRTEAHSFNANVIDSDVSPEVSAMPSAVSQPPFGSFDTPIDAAMVQSSIPVTGWALDDIEVTGVRIYRNPVGNEPTQPNGLVFVGDAVFVEGARPDVEAAYPGYPLNLRAGWGYMLLTNFLPNGGNGIYTLSAVSRDGEGNEVLLGQKTIMGDNVNAVKPFGTIDTPFQGGAASGSSFLNFGWALTPPPNAIPLDGSTIQVWVDGVALGHPVYDNYRADIASLFPTYANADGAVGYFYLDTTGYANGVHTISWSVTDSGGNADGLGSRYFQIVNGAIPAEIPVEAARADKAKESSKFSTGARPDLLPKAATPVFLRRGFDFSGPAEAVYPERDGVLLAGISALERVSIHLGPEFANEQPAELVERGQEPRGRKASRSTSSTPGSEARYSAFLLVLGEGRPLPIGATFDAERGVLHWQPGPGFLGEFDFVFVDELRQTQRLVRIRIGAR